MFITVKVGNKSVVLTLAQAFILAALTYVRAIIPVAKGDAMFVNGKRLEIDYRVVAVLVEKGLIVEEGHKYAPVPDLMVPERIVRVSRTEKGRTSVGYQTIPNGLGMGDFTYNGVEYTQTITKDRSDQVW